MDITLSCICFCIFLGLCRFTRVYF